MRTTDLEVVCTSTALAEAMPAWRAVWSALPARTPFLSPEWHEVWWRTLGAGTPEIVVVRDDNGPLAIAPFMRRDDGTLSFSGDDATDALDLVGDGSRAADPVARHLAEHATAIELRYLPAGTPFLATAPEVLRAAGFAVEAAPLVVSPRVELPRTFDEFVASLSKKDRHELRRKLRRLEVASVVKFAYASRGELEPALDRFVELHRRAPGEKGTFMTPRLERYFRELAAAGMNAGWLRLGELTVDGRVIASLYGFDLDGTFSAYNSAIDPDALALSPGVLLHAHAIRDAIARGLRTYDFLRGDEPYKYDLGGRDLVLWRLAARRRAA